MEDEQYKKLKKAVLLLKEENSNLRNEIEEVKKQKREGVKKDGETQEKDELDQWLFGEETE